MPLWHSTHTYPLSSRRAQLNMRSYEASTFAAHLPHGAYIRSLCPCDPHEIIPHDTNVSWSIHPITQPLFHQAVEQQLPTTTWAEPKIQQDGSLRTSLRRDVGNLDWNGRTRSSVCN